MTPVRGSIIAILSILAGLTLIIAFGFLFNTIILDNVAININVNLTININVNLDFSLITITINFLKNRGSR